MGVRINGVWHEELADPESGGTDSGAGRNYESPQQYSQFAGPASQLGGENLNWGGGTSGGGGTATGTAAAAGGDYGASLQQMMEAIRAGNAQAFTEAVRQFDLSFGLDKDKLAETLREFNESLALSAAAQTGTYQGAPTLPALTSYATQFGQWGVPQTGAQTLASQQQGFAQQQALAEMYGQGYSNFGAVPGGQQTLAAQQQAYAQQLGAINAAAALQANPFRQQQVMGQLGQVLGGGGVAGFSAPNTVAGVGTAGGNTRGGMGYLEQMIQDIRDPGSNTAGMNSVLDAIPTPNKINSTEFLRSAPSTQSMVLQGMQEKYGLDPNDALAQIKNTLPQFQAPTTAGALKR